MLFEAGAHGRRCHQGVARGTVESSQPAIAEFERNRAARTQILRKLRVISGGKRITTLQAPATRSHAQRAFGSDMNRVGGELGQ